jgi:hypothetical protein
MAGGRVDIQHMSVVVIGARTRSTRCSNMIFHAERAGWLSSVTVKCVGRHEADMSSSCNFHSLVARCSPVLILIVIVVHTRGCGRGGKTQSHDQRH